MTVAGREVELTATEYELLRVLSLNAGRVVAYDSLVRQVWSGRKTGDVNLVPNFVKKLRAKLGDDAQSPGLDIQRARGRIPHAQAAGAMRARAPTASTGEVSTRASRSARARRSAVRARVGDRGRGLGGEQHQDLFVGAGELRAALLLGEKEAADVQVTMPQRRALHRLRRHQVRQEAERPDVGGQVRQPKWLSEVAEVCEESRSRRTTRFRRTAVGQDLPSAAGVARSSDDPVALCGIGAELVEDRDLPARNGCVCMLHDGGASPGGLRLGNAALAAGHSYGGFMIG